jgi:hypothetical protein
MARQRRGGGFRPPELKGTLGTLLRTTLAQAGTLRDVLERGAREGRSRLDSALASSRASRNRTDALAELGEIVLQLIRDGEIDLGELPEVRDIVAHLDELDADADAGAASHEDEHDESIAAPPARNRFDDRRGATKRGGRAATSDRARARDDDGTVSSRTWSRPSPAKPAAPRVWRPPVDDAPTTPPAPAKAARPADEITARERPSQPARRSSSDDITTPSRPSKRKDPLRKGGIHFDDDEDLSEYMHPDDVPPKTPQGGE